MTFVDLIEFEMVCKDESYKTLPTMHIERRTQIYAILDNNNIANQNRMAYIIHACQIVRKKYTLKHI
ncbi:hypothetical protein DERF_007176 [Dermatophagoides farinae]|uniref:Uncharacterized protein n=1 Tax=Dermatophagoides farinae TaxID=6954 RepID=A0A922HYV0_DERFA|nr:hypothetical protein DERF_007176 [Dermatophagoides farinae]